MLIFFFFQAEDGIRDYKVTGVQTCALPIYAGPDNRRSHLCSYSLEDRKETVHGDVSNYEITYDGKKMLVKVGKEYAMIDLPKDKLELKDEKAGKDFRLKLAGLDMKLDRHAELNQIYNESWRHMS